MVDIFKKLTQKDEDAPAGGAKKTISVLVPTYNEYDNIVPLSKEITDRLGQLPGYEYELVFIDNASDDGTRDLLKMLCSRNKKIKAIFNAGNFGRLNSQYYGMCRCSGDCVILMAADFQEPPEMIPLFVEEWEKGASVVCGAATSAGRGIIKSIPGRLYRRLLKRSAGAELTEGFTGFGLYDRSVVDALRELDDPAPCLGSMIAGLGYRVAELPYERPERRSGKSHNTLYSLYDEAMLGFTACAEGLVRTATVLGAALFALSLISALAYLICKLALGGLSFSRMGSAPALFAVLLFGSLQLFFTGVIGEYIININRRTMRRPVVTEEQRINFDGDGERKKKR